MFPEPTCFQRICSLSAECITVFTVQMVTWQACASRITLLCHPPFKEMMWKKHGELMLLLNWCIMYAFISACCFNTNVKCLPFAGSCEEKRKKEGSFLQVVSALYLILSMLVLVYVAFWLIGVVHKWCSILCKNSKRFCCKLTKIPTTHVNISCSLGRARVLPLRVQLCVWLPRHTRIVR